MYYTGIDPFTMKKIYAPTDYREKQLQRALLQYRRPQNAPLVREALVRAGRTDLIGYGPDCLVRPVRNAGQTGTGRAKPSGAAAGSSDRRSGRNNDRNAGRHTGKISPGKSGNRTRDRFANVRGGKRPTDHRGAINKDASGKNAAQKKKR